MAKIEEEDDLLVAGEGGIHGLSQGDAENGAVARFEFGPHIHNLHGRQGDGASVRCCGIQ